jgi:hypothetical protein
MDGPQKAPPAARRPRWCPVGCRFEREAVGGRAQAFNLSGRVHELGASIFHASNM